MYIVFFISFLALLLTYLEQDGKQNSGMLWGFTLLFLLAAIRYNYGNDYLGYYTIYKEIVSYPLSMTNLVRFEYSYEPGWVLLNYMFKTFGGFYVLVAFVALVENAAYYMFIRRYVSKNYWSLAVFIYLFSTNYYLLNMSMLRQGMAISLFLFSFNFFKKKQIVPSLILIGLAWSIHKSAIILFPFVLLPYVMVNKKISHYVPVIIGALFVVLFTNMNITNEIYEMLMISDSIESYSDFYSQDNVSIKYGLGFLVNLIPFFLLLYFLYKAKNSTKNQRVIVVLATISTLIIPFGEIVPMIGRIGMYFGAFSIAAMPIVFNWIPQRTIATITMSLYIFMILYGYWGFFHSTVWQKAYMEYHTIFE